MTEKIVTDKWYRAMRQVITEAEFAALTKEHVQDLGDAPDANEIALTWVETKFVVNAGPVLYGG
jgi:hypothetical protein